MSQALTHQEALIHVMVMMSAVDRAMSDEEMERIGKLSRILPVFDDFDPESLLPVARSSATLLSAPEGLDILLELVREALPPRLYETAYALAVDIAAVDRNVRTEELRLLALLRDRLGLDKLVCAAIERGAQARMRR
ncbi:Tellurite resistance protein TerB [Rhizobium sp. Leaf384]|uniref:tellurite resistance TerB family protein n=1 Tax=unclassified Rhizobium TaxID=2613769 RepID=UPI000715AA57|nr:MULTISPECIES: tellurite resistance TerB family protein [unclassified Rhizobium]KQR77848.1 Tellurite resistance protein TerB [Rhizobium sp. Leaf341]KQS81058.1 Tellurite resistance protein TerB [Rhizobium sp. Leaf384]KQS86912.1 Tellurite resistance protein TerB [Rhizobium sp. Leaf383]